MNVTGIPSAAVLAARLSPETQAVGQAIVSAGDRAETEQELAQLDRTIRGQADRAAAQARREAAEKEMWATVVQSGAQIVESGFQMGSNFVGGQTKDSQGRLHGLSHEQQKGVTAGTGEMIGATGRLIGGVLNKEAEELRATMDMQRARSEAASERVHSATDAMGEARDAMREAVQQARTLAEIQASTTEAAIGSRA